MKIESLAVAMRYASGAQSIDYETSFQLSRFCGQLLLNKESEHQGRDLVIRIRNIWNQIPPSTHAMWNDLTEAAGLYPYVNPELLSKSALLRFEYHKSPFLEDVYLHEQQQELSVQLQSRKSVVVSAPTSFGKSLLIEEVVASLLYKNVVVIQPTLALLDETRKKLLKYKDRYKIIVTTSQEPDTARGNIFLFTGERVMEYLDFATVDFFIIDEFYKLSIDRDDDRAIALNQAFQKLLRFTNKFYLLGPVVKNIPTTFKDKFDLIWFPTEFATVAVDELSLEITGKLKANERKQIKKQRLFELLEKTPDQTLIYCSSPNKATQLALEYTLHLSGQEDILAESVIGRKEMIDWISENINEKWSLCDALQKGIAFHHGALPRHLGSSIVDAFNIGSVRWLFCTSTLIEGVNTSAKNVILYDKEKGTKKIDFFDYKNIAGRSGRMKKHFIGNVIRFEKQPDQMELFVDIPLFDQQNAPLEILASMDRSELEDVGKKRISDFEHLPDAMKIVLRKNASISIEGQKNIIRTIESDISTYLPLLSWNSYPNYEQLRTVIGLAWNNLLKL